MTFRRIAPFVIVSLGLFAAVALRADPNEEERVRAAAGHYLKGHATGDPEEFRKAFHPESKLFWIKDGALAQRTSADYIAGAAGKPASDEAQRKRRIVSVDITGDAAVVKIELDYPNVFLTDYLSMLKIDGEWKIINKIFHARPKKTS